MAVNVGTLEAVLKADTTQFSSGMGKASKSLGSFQDAAKASRSAALAFGASFAAISGALLVSAKAADVQRRAELKLAQAIKNTGDTIDIKKILDLASSLQKVTTFGDEATIEMAALATTFGLTESQLLKLLPRVQNLSALQGVDLRTAVLAVGKAVTGTIGGLSRYGVILSSTETETFKTLNATEQFDFVMKKLDATAGGMAETLSKTGIGAMTQFGNAVGDVVEQIGFIFDKPIEKFFKDLTSAAEEVGQQFNDLSSDTKGLVSDAGLAALAITGLGTAFFGAVAGAGALTLALPALKAGLISLVRFGGPAALALVAIAAAATAVGLAFEIMASQQKRQAQAEKKATGVAAAAQVASRRKRVEAIESELAALKRLRKENELAARGDRLIRLDPELQRGLARLSLKKEVELEKELIKAKEALTKVSARNLEITSGISKKQRELLKATEKVLEIARKKTVAAEKEAEQKAAALLLELEKLEAEQKALDLALKKAAAEEETLRSAREKLRIEDELLQLFFKRADAIREERKEAEAARKALTTGARTIISAVLAKPLTGEAALPGPAELAAEAQETSKAAAIAGAQKFLDFIRAPFTAIGGTVGAAVATAIAPGAGPVGKQIGEAVINTLTAGAAAIGSFIAESVASGIVVFLEPILGGAAGGKFFAAFESGLTVAKSAFVATLAAVGASLAAAAAVVAAVVLGPIIAFLSGPALIMAAIIAGIAASFVILGVALAVAIALTSPLVALAGAVVVVVGAFAILSGGAVALFGAFSLGMAAFVLALATNSESFKKFNAVLEEAFGALVAAVEPVFQTMMPFAEGLLLMATALTPLLRIFGNWTPVAEFLFQATKDLVLVFLGSIIALGGLIEFLRGIEVLGVKILEDVIPSFDGIVDAAAAAEKAVKEIEFGAVLEREDADLCAAAAAMELCAETKKVTEDFRSLTKNIPADFNVALARFRAGGGPQLGGGGQTVFHRPVEGSTGGITINGPLVVVTNDPRNIGEELRRNVFFRGGTSAPNGMLSKWNLVNEFA